MPSLDDCSEGVLKRLQPPVNQAFYDGFQVARL